MNLYLVRIQTPIIVATHYQVEEKFYCNSLMIGTNFHQIQKNDLHIDQKLIPLKKHTKQHCICKKNIFQ